MCLIVLAWRVHPDYPLIVAANRDEFYQRPTAFAERWPASADAPQLIAGRDLESGGTWLGLSQPPDHPGTWRFAAVTNYRDPTRKQAEALSRGRLTRDFLTSTDSPASFLAQRQPPLHAYGACNLLLGDGQALHYASNVSGEQRLLASGIHALSNHLLDTPWPKLKAARQRFAAAITGAQPDEEALFHLLSDRQPAEDDALPQTGVPLHWERLLSPIFVSSPEYGTRASSVLLIDRQGDFRLREKSFAPTATGEIACINDVLIAGSGTH